MDWSPFGTKNLFQILKKILLIAFLLGSILKGCISPLPNEWGMISFWAWQLSRGMDYIVKDKNIDKKKVIAIGHSRLGKAALWAAAQDERFAMAVSNNSGCGEKAMSRKQLGENIEAINWRFPQWFCGNFNSLQTEKVLCRLTNMN